MADAYGAIVVSGSQTTAAAMTIAQLVAGANRRVKLLGVSVTFNGTVNTNAPVLVELLRQSSTGTSTTATPVKMDPSMAESLITSGLYLFTAEPTPGEIIDAWYIHPQAGVINPLPMGQEHKVGGAGRLGLRVTAANSVLCTAVMRFEE